MARRGGALAATGVLVVAAGLVPAALVPAGGLLRSAAAYAAPAPGGCGPTSTEQLLEEPWELRRLRPELAWGLSRGDGITVAVIDSGVSPDHPALRGKVGEGLDLIDKATHGQCDDFGHGTFVAGIIAGRDTDDSLYRGVAPAARILPIRVLRNDVRVPDASPTIAAAIRFAVDRGARVINLSLTTEPSSELLAEVRYAHARGVVLVAAAGNEGESQRAGELLYPAAYPEVIAVAGIDRDGRHVSTSSTGNYVDIAAPGLDLVGAAPRGGGYGRLQKGGTSFAAAYVSGVAALLLAYHPETGPDEVYRRITATADHPPGGRDDNVGYGVVNAYRALTAIGEPNRTGGAGVVPVDDDALRPVVADDDPLDGVRRVSVWVAFLGVVAAGLVLAGSAAARHGRRRGWRPGRR